MATQPSTRSAALTAPTLAFLSDLVQNNYRDWFHANRARYDAAKSEIEAFTARLIDGASTFHPLPNTNPKDCIFRINRDIRFSKDKAPYKSNFAIALGPGGRHSGQIDYYLHIQPGNESFLGAGMWQATPAQLAAFRQEIDYNPDSLKDIIEADEFRKYFPEVSGESTKTAPKGYSSDHPDIDLLKRKQLFFMHRYTDKEVLKSNFADEVLRGCRLVKPYCDYLNELFFSQETQDIQL
ncbi:DUF2461 domain-containing protein [Fibrella forsythiae]|uniref:DUF2461 domain-containing protein n=1 Tax=Fibrella forsythiae TaxID=2817061 RepID=A0ABS3JAQ6_9BACT|nr:DUF2461 domain-containing protein [Fibrella forsythiae]MBO0947076.1 DUF2461 domain-containing protein [Fibrella forsythiae]